MDALRYSNYDIVFQEVPGEVTLAINITGCPHRCKGCHSSYLQEYFGELLLENLESLIEKYRGMITCVAFMGGDQNISDLSNALRTCKNRGIKTCVYSGANEIRIFDDVISYLDYLKIGKYEESCGGLDSLKTNQKFFVIQKGKPINMTYLFWKPKAHFMK